MNRPPRQPLDSEAARQKALRLLGRREHSARELGRKLRQGGVEATAAAELVDTLAEEGWQSDPRFAATRVHNRIAQGYGPLRIRAELQVAGVPEAVAVEALATADCDWLALCVTAHRRRFDAAATDRAERQRQYNYLAQRGFSGEHIRAALSGDVTFDE